MVDIFLNLITSGSALLDSVCGESPVILLWVGVLLAIFFTADLLPLTFTIRYPKRTVVCPF